MQPLPDWQLPPGFDRGLWDYVQNSTLASEYDVKLAGTPLLDVDVRFCEQSFIRPGRLIDLGCGTGRLLLHFAAKGHDCTGVDLSPGMLQEVRRKADDAKLNVDLIEANLVELDAIPDSSFDWAACLFSTLGMLRGRDNRRRFLADVARILRPEGRFVVHVHNRGFQLWTRGGLKWTLGQWWRGLRGQETGGRTMQQTYGGASLTLHHFRRREILRELKQAGLHIQVCEPVSTQIDGHLRGPGILPSWRAYGFLIEAVRVRES